MSYDRQLEGSILVAHFPEADFSEIAGIHRTDELRLSHWKIPLDEGEPVSSLRCFPNCHALLPLASGYVLVPMLVLVPVPAGGPCFVAHSTYLSAPDGTA